MLDLVEGTRESVLAWIDAMDDYALRARDAASEGDDDKAGYQLREIIAIAQAALEELGQPLEHPPKVPTAITLSPELGGAAARRETT